MEKIRLSETLIVEGKYDKIRLSQLFDANILELGGFRIYNDKQRLALIRRLAERDGIIIVTDSDSAGFRIRHYLGGSIPGDRVRNVYIPNVHGKEKRKQRPGKEMLIGVEGMSTESLLTAFANAGIDIEHGAQRSEPFSKAKLYELGLSGGENSAKIRRMLCEKLSLPVLLSANSLAELLPQVVSEQELSALVLEIEGQMGDIDQPSVCG